MWWAELSVVGAIWSPAGGHNHGRRATDSGSGGTKWKDREGCAGVQGATEKGKGGSLPVPSGDLGWTAIAPSSLPTADTMIMALNATRPLHLSHSVFPEPLSGVQWNPCPVYLLSPLGSLDAPG